MAGVGRGSSPPRGKGRAKGSGSGSDSDSDSDDGMFEGDMVGLLADTPDAKELRLLSRWMFPSKVGGRPAWLVPTGMPALPPALAAADAALPASPSASSEAPAGGCAGEVAEPSLACTTCCRPLRFLMQVYASRGNTNKDAFHRTLHVFVCTECQPNEVRVFRAQLPRKNKWYSDKAPDADAINQRLLDSLGADPELDACCCRGCGLPLCCSEAAGGDGQCPECARRKRYGDAPAVFQEREITTVDADAPEIEDDMPARELAPATTGDEVEEMVTPGVAAETPSRDLVAEADGVIKEATKKGASEAVLNRLEEYRAKVMENADHAIDGTEQAVFDEYTKEKGEHDPVFSLFNRYVAANHSHVARYNFGGQPLWFCGPGQLDREVPPCPYCGGERVFEFQVQPLLISHLHGTGPLAERLDFGTVLVYSCAKSCGSKEGAPPYAEEFAFVQAEPHEGWLPKGA